MGAGGSKPPPPPRVSKKLVGTTVQIQHLPPLVTSPVRGGIQAAAEAKFLYVSAEQRDQVAHHVVATRDKLSGLILEAHGAGNFRDYLSLLVEHAVLGLSTKSGRPSIPLLELAGLVNPFLSREREISALWLGESHLPLDDLRFATSFRHSDLDQVADEEKDVLVLLYYSCDVPQCAEEALDFISRNSEKSGAPDILQTRLESFSETEIYTQWVTMYITTYLGSNPPGVKLSAAATSRLQVETGSNLKRLLTICDMLLREHRLDQICMLLQFLAIAPYPETQAWYRRRVQRLARDMKKKKNGDRALKDGHVEVADRILRDMKCAKDTGKDRWGWKGGVQVTVGDTAFDLHKAKKD